MDIAGLSMAMSMIELQNNVGAAMMDKTLESMEDVGEGIVKMMESSVMPNLGQNIDISV